MKKLAFLSLAWASLSLGILGIFLPLLPTTPFVLVAAYGFSKSSERFHQWLLNHKLFGLLVSDWQRSGVIRLKSKLLATVSIVLMIGISLSFVSLPVHLLLLLIGSVLCVLAFIWTRPSMPDQLQE